MVIICKNEAHIILKTLESTRQLASEWIVYDTGSTDGTVEMVRNWGATLVHGEWLGYGSSKRKAIELARHDWILNLDSDEVLSDEAISFLSSANLSDPAQAFNFPYRHFIGNRCIKYGEFGGDWHVRLFNRKLVHWNDLPVHEQLQIPAEVRTVRVAGPILHYTMKDTQDFAEKTMKYAFMNAQSYHARGKRSGWIKQYIAPRFTFFKYYLLKLGFLDGYLGLFAARMASLYVYLKYARLRELEESDRS